MHLRESLNVTTAYFKENADAWENFNAFQENFPEEMAMARQLLTMSYAHNNLSGQCRLGCDIIKLVHAFVDNQGN